MLALVIREVYHVSFIMYKISFCRTSRLRTSDGGNATFILSLLLVSALFNAVQHCFNGEITVYDSLKPTMSSALSHQLQHVYGDKSGEPVRVKVYMCQKQNAESDCGLFAIANALALAKGVSLKTVVFSQSQMRSHLHNCLQNELLTMFPHKLIENNAATEVKSFIIS